MDRLHRAPLLTTLIFVVLQQSTPVSAIRHFTGKFFEVIMDKIVDRWSGAIEAGVTLIR